MRFASLFAMIAFLTHVPAVAIASEPVTMAVSATPLSTPVYVAFHKGYFADEGLNIILAPVNGGHRAMEAVLSGDADFATSSDMVIMESARDNATFALLATFVSSTQDVGIIARSKHPEEPLDLTGKRIGYTEGTASHFFLDTYLLLSGMSPESASYVHTQPEQMKTELQSGNLDAVATWEPWLTMTQMALGESSTKRDDTNVYTLTFNLISRPELANSPIADKVLKALLAAERFIQENPSECLNILAERLALDKTLLEQLWDHYEFYLRLDQFLVLTLENQWLWAERNKGKATISINFLKHIYPSSLRRVAPDRIELHR